MCLGIPGKIVELIPNAEHPNFNEGVVDFDGVRKRICLAYEPDAALGEYVIVHAGFAISRVDEQEARRVWKYLEEMEAIQEELQGESAVEGLR